MNQSPHPCRSCPWLKTSDRGSHFDPEVLKKTVVEYLDSESLHPCHSRSDTFCAGFLSFVEQYGCGVLGLKMGRLAFFWQLLAPDKIPKLETFDSVEQMLQDHRDRLETDRFVRAILDKNSELF